MHRLLDLLILVAAIVSAPVWMVQMWRKGKLNTDWAARVGWRLPNLGPLPDGGRPRILIHAVSVGEVNAIRLLVDQLADSALAPQIVISVTTDTGLARAREIFGPSHTVVRFPFDFDWSMRRFLKAVNPSCVLLAELELWPNFLRICENRKIKVVVVNGRLSERSFKRSMKFRWLLTGMFRRIDHVCAQDQTYANRFVAMGADPSRVTVTGTMKWDTAQVGQGVSGSDELAREMGIDRTKQLVVAGSTAPEEIRLIDAACPQGVQLLCAPRKPEWFSLAVADLPNCAVRTRRQAGSSSGRFVLDTIGELRKAYALADLVIVGRSFGNLHGSDMMEPAALGKPVLVGPRTGDFQATADALLGAHAMVQVSSGELAATLARMLGDPVGLAKLGEAARAIVAANQGATRRNCDLVMKVMGYGERS